ncbi:hypothetical protein ACLBVI_32380, partial [Pseudomonas aeruginosa]
SAENVRRCLLIRHLSHGEDSRLNRCPGSVDHYRGRMKIRPKAAPASLKADGREYSRLVLAAFNWINEDDEAERLVELNSRKREVNENAKKRF